MDSNSTSGNGGSNGNGLAASTSQDQADDSVRHVTGIGGSRSGIVSSVNLKGNWSGSQPSAATLRTELSSLKSDLDALVNRSASLSDEELVQAHAQLMTKFSTMRYAARGIATEAGRQINRGVETTTTYVKDKPVQSMAVAVGAGLLLSLLFKRR
ncbi:DUF883 domain-containing protein [Noviherbaspirillum sp. CPCC 100848]|uniref:DUF883 domain-containing protein n=1 Tax=Noviherbaspirillum album TaxID=3080276 RepID=A0ABU6J7G3_9BURK|nr:DUF883 domain-containing protein [Noviherbaspirillum sp. CPCC 100848]MEC4719574.1 DUF883 domain-containing protein [Noviherbaspirillum sp. CPCC 100848]